MATTAPISSYNFSQLTDLIDRRFLDAQKEMPYEMKTAAFVKKDTLPKGTGDTRRYAEFIDSDLYAKERNEGDASQEGLSQYGYEKDAQVYDVSLIKGITKHMRDTGKDQQMIRMIMDLANVCPNRQELDLAHRLSFAWDTSYTTLDSVTRDISCGDSLAVISASHTLTGSSTTYSTQISGNPQFSKGSLETAEKSFVEESYDNFGLKRYRKPDTIITTDDPNTCHQVRELLNATANVDTSNSATYNVYANAYKHVKVSRIATTATGAPDTTKAKYWFLADSTNSDFYFTVLNAPYLKAPRDGNNGEDFATETRSYLAATDYTSCIVTAKWIRGSKGDGS
jgi:hypothetical protein